MLGYSPLTSPAMQLPQRELHERLKAESIATRERIAKLLRPVDGAALNEHPEPTGWSVAEVLEHLCITDEEYEPAMKALFAGARADAGAPLREWRPTFLGGLLANMLEKPRAMKAPKKFQPGPTPRNGVVERFLAREMTFMKTMDDAAQLDWRALKIASPAAPGFFPKLNLGDVFRTHVVHVTRHGRQIERLVKQLR